MAETLTTNYYRGSTRSEDIRIQLNRRNNGVRERGWGTREPAASSPGPSKSDQGWEGSSHLVVKINSSVQSLQLFGVIPVSLGLSGRVGVGGSGLS